MCDGYAEAWAKVTGIFGFDVCFLIMNGRMPREWDVFTLSYGWTNGEGQWGRCQRRGGVRQLVILCKGFGCAEVFQRLDQRLPKASFLFCLYYCMVDALVLSLQREY